MSKDRPSTTTFNLSEANARFVTQFGGARMSNGTRYNFSAEVDRFLDQLRLNHSPESLAIALLNEREDLQRRLEALEHRSIELLGTTLEDYQAAHEAEIRAHQETIRREGKKAGKAKRKIRKEVEDAFELRRGKDHTERQDLEWLKSLFRDHIRELGVSPLKLVRELRKGKGTKKGT